MKNFQESDLAQELALSMKGKLSLKKEASSNHKELIKTKIIKAKMLFEEIGDEKSAEFLNEFLTKI